MRATQSNIALGCSGAVDTVTILWTAAGKLATKQVIKETPESELKMLQYDAGYLFAVSEPWPVDSIYELSELLQAVEEFPRALIIRGAPKSREIIGTWVRRKGSGDGDQHEGDFETPAAGRYYVLIDVDKYRLPKGWKLDPGSVLKICEHIVSQLPSEFHDVSYHWQLSSSAGLGDPTKVSLHLWFWLDAPVPDFDLKSWAKHVNEAAGIKLIDDALFQHVQAHYTAAPIFKGLDDPFPTRSGLARKAHDSVSLVLPAPKPEPCASTSDSSSAEPRRVAGESGFEYHLRQIGDHPGGGGFHIPIIQATASYVATYGAQGTDPETLYAAVRNRVLAADASRHDAGYIEQMASREHISSATMSAQKKYGRAERPQKSRLHRELASHYISTPISAEEAQKRLEAQVADLF